jgi:hypothetical protein
MQSRSFVGRRERSQLKRRKNWIPGVVAKTHGCMRRMIAVMLLIFGSFLSAPAADEMGSITA